MKVLSSLVRLKTYEKYEIKRKGGKVENFKDGQIICKVTESELQEMRKIEEEDIDLDAVMKRFFATAMDAQKSIRSKKYDWFAKVKEAHGLNSKDPAVKFSVSPESGEVKVVIKQASHGTDN